MKRSAQKIDLEAYHKRRDEVKAEAKRKTGRAIDESSLILIDPVVCDVYLGRVW